MTRSTYKALTKVLPVCPEFVDQKVLILGGREGSGDERGETLLLALDDLPAVLQARYSRVPAYRNM